MLNRPLRPRFLPGGAPAQGTCGASAVQEGLPPTPTPVSWAGPSPAFAGSLSWASLFQLLPAQAPSLSAPQSPHHTHPAQTPPLHGRTSVPPAPTRLSPRVVAAAEPPVPAPDARPRGAGPSLARGAALTGGKRPLGAPSRSLAPGA